MNSRSASQHQPTRKINNSFVKLTHWKDVSEYSTHRPLAEDDAGHSNILQTQQFSRQHNNAF